MIIVILVILGLCLGSFVNALVWRLHEQAKKKSKAPKELSILKGRSMCPHCRHELAAKDLIPVLSWLWLRGKCRYCRKPIADSPLVELTTALLFIISYIWWPFAFTNQGVALFYFWLVFLVGLIALAVYDLRWYLLPNRLTYPLLTLAVLQTVLLASIFGGSWQTIWQATLSVLIGGGLFYLLFQVSGGKWIGGGDVKLGALLGLILADPQLAVFMIFTASLLGTLVAVPLMAIGKANKSTRLPFGPFLIVSAIIAYLFGQAILTWYRRQFLLI